MKKMIMHIGVLGIMLVLLTACAAPERVIYFQDLQNELCENIVQS